MAKNRHLHTVEYYKGVAMLLGGLYNPQYHNIYFGEEHAMGPTVLHPDTLEQWDWYKHRGYSQWRHPKIEPGGT